MLGILAQEKQVPLRYCPLTIELGLVSNSVDCVYEGPVRQEVCNSNCGISDIQCKMDLLTIDSSLQNEYTSHLLSGRSLPINFSSYNHTNQSTHGDKGFSANIHRALTLLKPVFVTLLKEGGGVDNVGPPEVLMPGMRKTCNYLLSSIQLVGC